MGLLNGNSWIETHPANLPWHELAYLVPAAEPQDNSENKLDFQECQSSCPETPVTDLTNQN